MCHWLCDYHACSLERIVGFFACMEVKEIIGTLHQSDSLYLYIWVGVGSMNSCFFSVFFLLIFIFYFLIKFLHLVSHSCLGFSHR